MMKGRESEASRVYALGQEGELLAGSPGKKGLQEGRWRIYPCHLLHETEACVVLSIGQLFSPVTLEATIAGPKKLIFQLIIAGKGEAVFSAVQPLVICLCF